MTPSLCRICLAQCIIPEYWPVFLRLRRVFSTCRENKDERRNRSSPWHHIKKCVLLMLYEYFCVYVLPWYYLHWVDSCLSYRTSQRSGDKPLMNPQIFWVIFATYHILDLYRVNRDTGNEVNITQESCNHGQMLTSVIWRDTPLMSW